MAGPSVTFEGWPAAAADMERWARELGPAVDRGTRDVGERIVDRTQSAAPVLTGTFASSVELVDVAAEAGLAGWAVAEGVGVPYAWWLEFGGSRSRALVPEGRYLYPTALEADEDYARAAAEAATDSAERFSWHQQH